MDGRAAAPAAFDATWDAKGLRNALVDWTLRLHRGPGFEREMSEGVLILRQILLQHIPQCFGLLRAQVDRLKGIDGDLFGRILMGGAEGQAKIPHAFLHLNAVGIALAVVGRSVRVSLWVVECFGSWCL